MSLAYVPGSFPKPCSCCRRVHTEPDWLRLHLVGWTGTIGLQLELRDCDCGSTISVEVSKVQPPHEDEELGEAALA